MHAIVGKKQIGGEQGRTFVAVNEWVIAGYSLCEACSKDENIRLAIGKKVFGATKCGFKQCCIPQTIRPATDINHEFMYGFDIKSIWPFWRDHRRASSMIVSR